MNATVALRDVCAFITKGATPTTYGLTWQKTGVPFLRSECVSDAGLDMRQSMYISVDADLVLKRSQVADGDILMTITGNVGRVVRLTGLRRANINQHIARIRVKDPRVDPQFVYHYLSQPRIRDYYESIVTGQAYPQISLVQVRETRIPLLPVSEQRQIAEALSDADGMIESLERLITKKQAIKQGMMQELLTGRTRLPGFAGKWHLRTLGDLLSYEQPTRYLVKTAKQLDTGRIPVLTAGKTFILGYTNELEGVYASHPVIIFDDFTTASQYVDFDFKAKSSAMKILSARPGVDLRFAYERMKLIEFPLGDHKRYWISEYSKQEIEVPRQEEQTAISHVIADADRERALLELRLTKARALKQGMMQELLTGRTRLPLQEAVA